MTKVSFFTLGCRVNQTETAVLENDFRQKGFRIVDGDSAPDIAVINSCTVTGQGDLEALRIMGRVRKLNAAVRIALIGCQAQVQKKKLLALANVCWVVGTARKMSLADIILAGAPGQTLCVASPERKPFTMPIVGSFGRRVRANLKIQDGCDNFCAYCEVPFARGRARSRMLDDVMKAARALVLAGHKEIVLTGINVGRYADEGRGLLDVIKELETLEGLKRIRLSSIEFTPWVGRLAELMQPPHKLCRFLHMPLQSGCERTLRRMGRKHTADDVAHVIRSFAAKVPGVMIGTDIIAGFPGETEKDFDETCAFLSREPLHYAHVFSYSDRNRARSRSFQGAVPAHVIARRARQLRDISRARQDAFLRTFIGSTGEVLLEHKKGDDWIGHTDNYVTIKMLSGRNVRGHIVPVKFTGVEGPAVRGVIS